MKTLKVDFTVPLLETIPRLIKIFALQGCREQYALQHFCVKGEQISGSSRGFLYMSNGKSGLAQCEPQLRTARGPQLRLCAPLSSLHLKTGRSLHSRKRSQKSVQSVRVGMSRDGTFMKQSLKVNDTCTFDPHRMANGPV